ncbi:hypothetical protein DSO57_1028886 [Entomophthora muscae]|uniref:Uncharacterized protein n=1 Tax=Entomophthora muscae TaxID=34485 RepID=A0ACC2TNT2_9FUNG|nr:hypothetical protein DSO57_1028886 [Entomophthora muscae]
MKGILFLSWFLVLLLTVVLGLEYPTHTTDWHNSSSNYAHQKESLANGWFKYSSGHWGRKFHYGCNTTPPPPVDISLVRPNTSFCLLTYLVGYYLLSWFSSMMGRFAYLGQLGNFLMVMVPIGLVIAGLNIGALDHQIGGLFPLKWVPDTIHPFASILSSHMPNTLYSNLLRGYIEESIFTRSTVVLKVKLWLECGGRAQDRLASKASLKGARMAGDQRA